LDKIFFAFPENCLLLLNLDCLWKDILSQQRIRHFKILQSVYFAYDVGIISFYSNRINFSTANLIKPMLRCTVIYNGWVCVAQMEKDFATLSEKCLVMVFYARKAIILPSFSTVTAKSN